MSVPKRPKIRASQALRTTLRQRREAALRSRVAELEARIAEITPHSGTDNSSLPYLAHLGSKVKHIEQAVAGMNHSVQAIYESRIWKTLQQLCGLALWAATFGKEKLPSAPSPPRPMPAAGAAAPIASPAGEKIVLVCERPSDGGHFRRDAVLQIRGWAAAESRVDRVEISVGGVGPIPANFGLRRTGLDSLQQSMPGASEGGFEFSWPCESMDLGRHEIVITAVTRKGARQSLNRHVEVIRQEEDEEDSFEFHLDSPDPELLTPVRESVEVRGWAWSPEGVAKVEVLSEGKRVGFAELGLKRPDVARDHPDWVNAESSGFVYNWDVAGLPAGRRSIEVVIVDGKGVRRTSKAEVIVDPRWTHIYEHWIRVREPDAAARKRLAEDVAKLPVQPVISILAPVYKTPMPYLKRCVESMLAQRYKNWELCLADDGSNDPELSAYLDRCTAEDSRIRVAAFSTNGGISRATNAALSLAGGDFIAFLDSDDELPDHALCEVVRAINARPDVDVFYSDEDKIDEQGQRFDPFFKPDWSPELFLSCNYLCHFIVVRRELALQVNGLDESYRDGTQDYDFLLRVTELTQNVHRIPAILYHWRAIPGSTAQGGEEKPKSTLAGQRALAAYAERSLPGAEVSIIGTGRYRVRFPVDDSQRVTVVMPTGGNLSLLEPIVEDLFTKTAYRSLELLLVDNSKGSGVDQLHRKWRERGAAIRYLDRRGAPFNYSRLNNEAVRETDAPLILFLNDDMRVIEPDWLTAMAEHAQRPEIGAVGSLLLYPSGMIQHAGVVMGVFENSAHLFRGLPPKPGQHFDLPVLPRNCSAVTAACLLTRREVFWEVDGFNEKDLAVAFQDVDLCLKIRSRGYRIVYTPFSRLHHLESVTKAEKIPNPAEVSFMQHHWAQVIDCDPYYNPNLTRKDENYSLRFDD
jgi:GT2 family glycosyltransferase